MNRTLKVFCTGKEQDRVAESYPILARYDAFVLVQVAPREAKRLSRRFPVEDITHLYKIRLEGRAIDTSRPRLDVKGKVRSHPAYKGLKQLPPGPHHYLVQFAGPIKREWLKAVEKAGGELRAPQGDFTYVVRCGGQALRRVAALPGVRWVGHLCHHDRVDASVQARAGKERELPPPLPRTRLRPGVYTVSFFGAEDMASGLKPIRNLGFKLLARDDKAGVIVVEATARGPDRLRSVEKLSAVHGVRAIRGRSLKRSSNDVAAGLLRAERAQASPGLGLSGKGERVAVCDTGLDSGKAAAIHQDFAHRVVWIKSYPITSDWDGTVENPGGNDGAADVDSGHGTHVAGSVLGSGAGSIAIQGLQAPIRGLAYKAKLVFQAVEQEMDWTPEAEELGFERFALAGIPLDLTDLFRDAYKKKARIHSNSWGGGDPGAYDEQCEQLDRFVWEHKNFCVLASAGNDGTDKDGDGKINPMSVSSPGTAKNCITVGGSESLRPQFEDETYGGWWPKDFPAAPFRDDPMADDPSRVMAFSSRGPTRDGRVKPDVVAPGTFILSTRSRRIALNNMAWGAFPPSRLYFFMGGTSMATPLTAGAVALLREYLRTRHSPKISDPTAALLKAALIAGAVRLKGYAGNNAVCDHHQGFGMVNVDNVVAPPGPVSVEFVEVSPGLQTGDTHVLQIKVKSSASPLRVVLAYSDFPGPQLVNNLNLMVKPPQGQRFLGNHSGTTSAADVKNNVEVVHVRQPRIGIWKIEVVGSNIPRGPQDFALAYTARLG